jgi:hypothetical protein
VQKRRAVEASLKSEQAQGSQSEESPMTPRLWWLLAGCSFVAISVGIATVHIARWEGNDQAYLWKLATLVVFTPVPLFPAGYCFSRFARLPGPDPTQSERQPTEPFIESVRSQHQSPWSNF